MIAIGFAPPAAVYIRAKIDLLISADTIRRVSLLKVTIPDSISNDPSIMV